MVNSTSTIHSISYHTEISDITVTVTSSPEPGEDASYAAGSSVTLTCEASGDGIVGALTFTWTSTCSLGNCFVQGASNAEVSSTSLHSRDSGTHTCTVTDEVGNFGSVNHDMNVIGTGLYHTNEGRLPNNDLIKSNPRVVKQAEDGETIGTLQCISGSTMPGVGEWVTPDGQILVESTDELIVTVGQEDDPGFLTLSLAPGQFLLEGLAGVYTCRVPDEAEELQELNTGIYSSDFNSTLSTDHTLLIFIQSSNCLNSIFFCA